MVRQSVAGIGGVVLFADHADSMAQWYEKHLGIFFTRPPDSHDWSCDCQGTDFAIHQTKHPLGRDRRLVEITWRVTDLDDFVEHLADLGMVVDERQETPDGGYAWFDDPEGNRIELWQAKEGA